MKYKISDQSEFTIVTEDGEFICNVIDDGLSIQKLLDSREHLARRARCIVAALNNADWAAINVQQTLQKAETAGLCEESKD